MNRFIPLFLCLLAVSPTRAAEPFRYAEGRHGPGQLKYVNGLPVLVVVGTPTEIGEQVATLARSASLKMASFPKEYVKAFGFESSWPTLVTLGKAMVPRFPADHLQELESLAKQAGIDRDLVIVGNTFTDIKKIGGCSALFVDADHSATRGPLLGRNLDYPTLGFLHEYSLVTVYRPKGKHAFASIGLPGLVGCLSGINDAGLALAVLEVYASNDDSPAFDPQGIPYALCYRRILEECSTVAEAETLLRSLKRTTRNNLAVCDPKGGAVFEITPHSLVVRRATEGFCPCTNHFRSKELARETICRRYQTLDKCRDSAQLGVADLTKLLDAVNQGDLTFQTMIFEPAKLKLHLAIGKCPTSALEPKTLDLTAYFQKK